MKNLLEYLETVRVAAADLLNRHRRRQVSPPSWQRQGGLVLLLIFVLIVLQDAFVCEDALITMRTVDNWLNGFGLRWNVNERLQVFTHPLWMFIMSAVYGITGEVFYSVIFFSVLVSAAAYYLLAAKIAVDGLGMVLGLTVLLFSRAYVDFSTSGLENPMVHLLLVVFAIFWKRVARETAGPGELFALSLISCLCVLTRMDTGFLFLPALLLLAWDAARRPERRRLLGALALGYVPFIAWEIFSVIYYGFPFPNTFYAKMAHGIPKAEILAQGLLYLRNSITWDPLTLFAILAGIFLGLSRPFRDRFTAVFSVGAALYVLYVVWVGGDHMGGRFLTGPLLAAVMVLAVIPLSPYVKGMVTVAAILLGLHALFPTLSTDFEQAQCKMDPAKILYERGCCKPYSSLASISRELQFHQHYRAMDGLDARDKGPHAATEGMAGIFGFYAGPEVHIIDPLGLTDPLLARLPANPDEWRIAHFVRPIPDGYREAVINQGDITDPSLAEYYDRLNVVTRGPIWSFRRFEEIWRFNSGAHDHLIEAWCRRRFKVVSCADLRGIRNGRRAQKVRKDRQRRAEDRANGK